MSTWMYQINQKWWPPERYRLEIWEDERWAWRVGRVVSKGEQLRPGDTVVFFYAPAGGADAGFYGWAVCLEWLDQEKTLFFRPVAPSNQLKMFPWWDENARKIADEIRGSVKRGTMWLVPERIVSILRHGITGWSKSVGAT